MVYRLPLNWNGKVLGVGGGGSAGNVTLQGAVEGLSRGYAVIQNDLGHASTNGTDWSFAITAPGKPNAEAVIDFGHRATHEATVAGKAVVSRFYGRPVQRSYWEGCSTGGRQSLAEVQRYPEDCDGVIAGAPVYSPLVCSNAMLRLQAFHARPESNLRPDHVPLIQKAVLASCDAQDGVVDGILTDPRACRWDPKALACGSTSADPASCLTPAQVDSVRRICDGVKTRDGKYAAMPLMRGGESDWVRRMIGTPEPGPTRPSHVRCVRIRSFPATRGRATRTTPAASPARGPSSAEPAKHCGPTLPTALEVEAAVCCRPA